LKEICDSLNQPSVLAAPLALSPFAIIIGIGGLIIIGLTIGGLIIAGLIIGGLIIAGLITGGLIIAGITGGLITIGGLIITGGLITIGGIGGLTSRMWSSSEIRP